MKKAVITILCFIGCYPQAMQAGEMNETNAFASRVHLAQVQKKSSKPDLGIEDNSSNPSKEMLMQLMKKLSLLKTCLTKIMSSFQTHIRQNSRHALMHY